jgi:hypothetical protein
LKKKNEAVSQISCGHKHVVLQTAVGRIYGFGLNASNQINESQEKYVKTPARYAIPEYTSLRCKPRNVQAGFSSTFVLFEDRQIYFSGLIGLNKGRQTRFPIRLQYEDKFFPGRLMEKFVPVKVFTKWSRSLSVTYLVLADLRTEGAKKPDLKFREKFVENVLDNWESDKQVLPSGDEILARYVNQKYLLKPAILRSEVSQ